MDDHLIRAIAPGVRGFAAITTNLVEEARQRHDCYPVAAAALGRTMTAALLLAANLKNDESITVRISGNGPLGEVVADANLSGAVRGYVRNPHIDLPLNNGKLDVSAAVGEGNIFVTRFTGLKQPFTGSVELVSGEIAEDVTNYLLVSEQTPSSVALGVLVKPDLTVAAAGGFFIQVMPDAEDNLLDQLEKNISVIPPVSRMISEGYNAEDILKKVFDGLDTKFYQSNALAFHCPCSRDKVEKVLISLGQEELTNMLEQEGQVELTCHFCANKHVFNREELGRILAQT